MHINNGSNKISWVKNSPVFSFTKKEKTYTLYPTRIINPPFNRLKISTERIRFKTFPINIPKMNDNINSEKRKPKKVIPNWSPFTIDLETVKQIENKIITNTSFTTVTPIAVLVKGPFALNSLITAIIDDGDLATKITPNKTETTIFVLSSKLFINGIFDAKK